MLKIKLLVLTLVLAVIMAGGVRGLEAAVKVYSDFDPVLNKAAWFTAMDQNVAKEDFTDQQLLPQISYETLKGSISPMGYWHDTLNSWSSNPSSTTWFFTPEITAFGGDWTLGGTGGSGNSLVVTLAEVNVVKYISSRYNGNFWGFISDAPITKVKLTGGTGTNQQIYFLDNLVFGPVADPLTQVSGFGTQAALATTPLPAGVWLLGGGLLLLFGLRRFQKS